MRNLYHPWITIMLLPDTVNIFFLEIILEICLNINWNKDTDGIYIKFQETYLWLYNIIYFKNKCTNEGLIYKFNKKHTEQLKFFKGLDESQLIFINNKINNNWEKE